MKPFEEILENTGIQLSDFEQHRKEQLHILKKKTAKGLTIGALIFVLSILFSILIFDGWILIAGFIIALITFFIIRGNTLGKLKRSFKENVIKSMIEMIDPSFEYHPYQYISSKEFKKSQFIKSWSSYNGEDHFKGIYKGIGLEFSEIHISQKSDKTNITVFKGPFYIIKTPEPFLGRTTVVRDYAEKLLGKFGRRLQKLNFTRDKLLHINNHDFERHFAVYSDNEDEAKAILNPMIISFLIAEQIKAKQVFFGFSGYSIYFGIFNSRNYYHINIKNEISEQSLRSVYNELAEHLDLVEQLYNLVADARKFVPNPENRFLNTTKY
jgi:hypothetical protein